MIELLDELNDDHDPNLKEAVNNLLRQMANFHMTCIDELNKHSL